MATIDIMSVIDAQRILLDVKPENRSQHPDKPTMLEHKYMYMVATNGSVLSGQAGGDLEIEAFINDIVRWRAASVSEDGTIDVVIYNFFKFGGQDVLGKWSDELTQPFAPIPDPENPIKYTPTQVPDFYWDAKVKTVGQESYGVYFYITSLNRTTHKLETLGYFGWDPRVTVKPITTAR